MIKVLVTGSKGFIGKNLSRYLTQQGYNLELLDSEYFQEGFWIQSLFKELDRINPKIVFHVGAYSNTLEKNVQFMMERNYESTKIIADWCNQKGSMLIYSSSAASYGVNGNYPSNLYGWSKYVAENYVCKSGGVSLRYFNVYGPGEDNKDKMASILYQAFLRKINGEPVYLYPGKPSRDFVFIKDVISANVYAMNNFSEHQGKFYEVSTGQSRTFESVMDLAGIQYSYLDASKIPDGYQFFTCGNPAKWLESWYPKYFLEDGITEYLDFLNLQIR